MGTPATAGDASGVCTDPLDTWADHGLPDLGSPQDPQDYREVQLLLSRNDVAALAGLPQKMAMEAVSEAVGQAIEGGNFSTPAGGLGVGSVPRNAPPEATNTTSRRILHPLQTPALNAVAATVDPGAASDSPPRPPPNLPSCPYGWEW